MINVIPAAKRNKSTSQQFGEAFSGALRSGVESYANHMEGKEQEKKTAQSNEQIAKEFGINLQGITDPDERKILLQEALKGKKDSRAYEEKLNQNKMIIADLEKRHKLDPGSLKAYESDPKMAKSVLKEPSRTQASQPIDPEQLNIITNVRKTDAYKKASPSQKYQMMTEQGVSRENAKAEADIAAEELKPSMFESESSKLAAKSSSEHRDTVVREYEGAKSSEMRIDKMMKKAESGQLSTPLMVKSLEYVGLPLSILNNPQTEEYAKLQNDYVRDVSTIFPGAIKNFEIESYMKTIPQLLNSDEGKILVGKNIKLLNEAKILKYQAMEQILKENNGVVPRNLDIAINDRTRDQMEDIKERFVNGVHESLDLSGPKVAMRDETGVLYDIPIRDIEKAIEAGLNIYNE